MLFRHGEQAAKEEYCHQSNADKVDAERQGGLRVAAGAEAVNGGEGEDKQREDVQLLPECVADARAQPRADADARVIAVASRAPAPQ